MALDGGRIRRPLRAGRPRLLSELGADERDPRQGRRRAAHRHGGAVAERRAQSAGARRRASWPASRRSTASAARRPSAALAYGTETIAPVAKIVGPGNAYVAAAKRLVFGTVGIDSIAGPSEVLIIADKHNNPEWIAADLLAQAEHDTAAQVDPDDRRCRVSAAPSKPPSCVSCSSCRAATSPARAGACSAPLSSSVRWTKRRALADRIAAEHLEIATADAEAMSERIRNAGAIFIGSQTPEMIGDYIAGSNHVLPTSRTARFSSGLGVLDFMKRTSLLKLDAKALAALAPAAMALARAEGLEAHRLSAEIRLKTTTEHAT